MTSNKNILGNVMSAFSFLLTSIQTDAIMQVIMLILSIISVIISISYTLYKWYKEAKRDGKIDKDEIIDGIKIVQDGIEQVKKEVDTYDNQRDSTKD